jgi:GDSL-like Lipase/Acylhydrolase
MTKRTNYFFYLIIAIFILFILEITVHVFFKEVIVKDTEQLFHLYNTVQYKKKLAKKLKSKDLYQYTFLQNVFKQAALRNDIKKELINKKTILFIGDSVLFGSGINRIDIFTNLLQKKLKNHEIVNIGLPGANIYQIHSLFNYSLKKSKPNIVIYIFNKNDLSPSALCWNKGSYTYRYFYYLFGYSQKKGLYLKPKISINIYSLLSKSSLYKYLILYVFPYTIKDKGYTNEIFMPSFKKLLNDINSECKKENIPFIICEPLNNKHVKKSDSSFNNILKQNCLSFFSLKLSENKFLADEWHLNKKGHEIISKNLYTILKKYIK